MNRREVLTGMAIAGVAAAVPAAAIAKSQPDREAWDQAMDACKRTYAASDAFDSELWRIEDEYEAAIKYVPHVVSGDLGIGKPISTEHPDSVSGFRKDMESVRYLEPCVYVGHKARQAFLDAVDERDAVIAEIDRRTGYSAAHERYDALAGAICDAEAVLLKLPAPDGEALMWKVKRLYTPGEGIWSDGVEDQTFADLQRFLVQGQA